MNLFPVVICNVSAHFNLAFRISDNGFLEVINLVLICCLHHMLVFFYFSA